MLGGWWGPHWGTGERRKVGERRNGREGEKEDEQARTKDPISASGDGRFRPQGRGGGGGSKVGDGLDGLGLRLGLWVCILRLVPRVREGRRRIVDVGLGGG